MESILSEKFDFTALDGLLERAETDVGLKVLINDMIMMARKAGYSGMSLKEVASVVTLGFLVSQDKELEAIMNYLLVKIAPEPEMLN